MNLFAPERLAEWCGGTWTQLPAAPLTRVWNHTRDLGPGDLYVALIGERHDGHVFVADAFAAGAGAALVRQDRMRPEWAGFPLLCVPDTLVALGALARGYRRECGARIIGITGSAGKSTVKEMLAQILAAAWPTACTRGNWNNAVGLPLSLLAMAHDTRFGVFEAGTNHPGEIAALCAVLEPDWGVITSVGPAHLAAFGAVERVAAEKGELLRALPPGGRAFLNRDQPFFDDLRARTTAPVVTVSTHAQADYRLVEWNGPARLAVFADRAGVRHALTLALPGRHNAENALLAAAVAAESGVSWDVLVPALERFKPMPMRWQVRDLAGVRVINDAYNASPLSMEAAFATFAEEPVAGARWLVLGGMLELGADETAAHQAIGASLARLGGWRGLVVVGPLGARIAEGALRAGFPIERVHACRDATEAGRLMAECLRPGDAVCLKASRGIGLEAAIDVFAKRRMVSANGEDAHETQPTH